MARLSSGLVRRIAELEFRRGVFNGMPALVTLVGDDLYITCLEIRDGLVTAVYTIGNPEKVSHVRDAQRSNTVTSKKYRDAR